MALQVKSSQVSKARLQNSQHIERLCSNSMLYLPSTTVMCGVLRHYSDGRMMTKSLSNIEHCIWFWLLVNKPPSPCPVASLHHAMETPPQNISFS